MKQTFECHTTVKLKFKVNGRFTCLQLYRKDIIMYTTKCTNVMHIISELAVFFKNSFYLIKTFLCICNSGSHQPTSPPPPPIKSILQCGGLPPVTARCSMFTFNMCCNLGNSELCTK